MSDEIRKKLDLAPFVPDKPESYNIQTEDDFEFARKAMYEIIAKSQQALEDMFDIAKSLQSPHAYEVLNSLLKNAASYPKDLIDIQKKRIDIAKLSNKDADKADTTTTNNNLFVGSNEDLNKLLNSMGITNDTIALEGEFEEVEDEKDNDNESRE